VAARSAPHVTRPETAVRKEFYPQLRIAVKSPKSVL